MRNQRQSELPANRDAENVAKPAGDGEDRATHGKSPCLRARLAVDQGTKNQKLRHPSGYFLVSASPHPNFHPLACHNRPGPSSREPDRRTGTSPSRCPRHGRSSLGSRGAQSSSRQTARSPHRAPRAPCQKHLPPDRRECIPAPGERQWLWDTKRAGLGADRRAVRLKEMLC